jgi:hypothetical protein
MGGCEHPAEVVDERRVDVEPAQLGDAARADDREAAALVADDRDVERAAPEVEDCERGAHGYGPAKHLGEVARGGDRLRQEPGALVTDRWPAGPGDRGDEHVAPARAPGGRVGHDGRWEEADRLHRRTRDRAEHGREQVGGGHLAPAEQHARLIDPALGVGLEPRRVALGQPLGVPADVQAGVVEEDGRRHDRLTVEDEGAGAAVRPAQDGHGVGRADVDAERVTAVRACHLCRSSRG